MDTKCIYCGVIGDRCDDVYRCSSYKKYISTEPKVVSVDPIPTDPLTTQVGGNHYKEMKIQPIEYALANNLPFVEANVVKYVSRWRKKGGVADLKKARHMLDLLIAHEESNTTNV